VTPVSASAQRIVLDVVADRTTLVVVRDAWAPGWSARVDGEPVPVLRADGRHRAVPIGPGRSLVEMRYRPPGLDAGLALAGLAAAAIALLLFGARSKEHPAPPLKSSIVD
jgi:uncharacterized membrane protein YfhO